VRTYRVYFALRTNPHSCSRLSSTVLTRLTLHLRIQDDYRIARKRKMEARQQWLHAATIKSDEMEVSTGIEKFAAFFCSAYVPVPSAVVHAPLQCPYCSGIEWYPSLGLSSCVCVVHKWCDEVSLNITAIIPHTGRGRHQRSGRQQRRHGPDFNPLR
jgi:hypothetical protein